MANWTITSAFLPTTLQSFTLTIDKQRASAPTFEYKASILDANGKQKWSLSGDVSSYVSVEELAQMESIIENLFEKAENEML